MHTSTPLFHHMALALGIALLAPAIASAQCSAAMESCTAGCDSSMTSGFIVGMAGALGRNSAAYQQGQNQLQQAQACAQRCSVQYDACNQREEAQRQQEEAMRRAQQQQAEAQRRAEQQRVEAQRQAQERAQAERQALQQRVNRVISPPVLPPLAIKDAAPLLLQAQEHEKDGNSFAAMQIYKMILQGSSQPKHQQEARAALRQQALDAFTYTGTREPGTYARLLAEYEPLGVFTPAEQTQLAAMAPESDQAADAAHEYLRKNPKGTLRGAAEAIAQAAPQLRARAAAEQKRQTDEQARSLARKAQEEEAERLATIRNARRSEQLWVRAKGSCRIYDSMMQGTLDVRWTGGCKDDYATGTGTYQNLGAEDRVLFQYEGPMVTGKMEGVGKTWWATGNHYEGEYRGSDRNGQGTFYWANGQRYQGAFVAGQMHGVGTYTWTTGTYFQGYWENGKKLNGAEYSSDGTLKAVCTLGQCVVE